MNVIGIDPGYAKSGRGNAVVLVEEGWLAQAWFERSGDFDVLLTLGSGYALHSIIIEKPQQDGRSWAVPPEVLINLAWEGAVLAGKYAGAYEATIQCCSPYEWKGSEHKPIQHARLWKSLSGFERAVLGGDQCGEEIVRAQRKGALDRWSRPGGAYYRKSFFAHNLLDAAAMVMRHQGRVL